MSDRRATLLVALVLAWSASAALAAEGDALTVLRAARQAELEAVTRDIEITRDRQAELRAEIEALDKDRATLNQSLIDAGQEAQRLETAIDGSETRLASLLVAEDALRLSLNQRRDVLVEVLAALQRLSIRPPPAMLVRPEDALESVRSAMLLGTIVPDLRSAAEELSGDLQELVALRSAQESERDRLRADATALIEGRERITLLLDEKRRQRAASVEALANEERRAAVLAEQATSLRELIARMESESPTAAAASVAADRAAAAARIQGAGRPAQSLGAADRLVPVVAFADARGLLPMPAAGRVIKAFGDNDGLGGRAQGISMATRPGAHVSSPTDGWIVYAGLFRSYGQLLLINAGDGYHVLLAGMDRIDVQLGQFVLAGEPVAAMPSPLLASTGAIDIGSAQQVLYIEFRKDGTSIDPTPWWAASNSEKVGG